MFFLTAACFSGNWVLLVKTVEIVEANILESVKFMSGKLLRVAIIHVSLKEKKLNWEINKLLFIVNKRLHFQNQLPNKQYPPSFILTRHSNGTVSYDGVSHEAMQYIAKALNIT